jgi:hypothetical protein
MTDQWFVKILGEELGPMPYSNLVDLVGHGSLSAEDQIRQTDKKVWVPARSVSGLFPDSSIVSDTKRSLQSVEGLNTTSHSESRSPSQPDDTSSGDLDVTEKWYCRVLGQELGPMLLDDLCKMARQGELDPADEVRANQHAQWVPARTVDALFSDVPDVWFCRILGQELGPMPLDDLCKMARQGELAPDEEVQSGRDSDWVSAKTVSQLFPQDRSSVRVRSTKKERPTSKTGPSTATPLPTKPVPKPAAVTTKQIQDPAERVTATKKSTPAWRPAVTPSRDPWHELFIEKLKDHPKTVLVTGSSIVILSILYFVLFTGGSQDALHTEFEEAHPLKLAYPIMLDGQTLRVTNTN